jgi:histone H2A
MKGPADGSEEGKEVRAVPLSPSASSDLRPETKTVRARLQFPVGRISRRLNSGKYAKHVGRAAPVFLAAVLEYLTAEVLQLAGCAACKNKMDRITPRHIQLVMRNDAALNALTRGVK